MFFGSILAGTIGVLYHLESKDYLEKLELEEQVTLKLQIKLIANNFEAIISDLKFLSQQNELTYMINANQEEYQDWIANEYLALSRQKRIYDQIRYLDAQGMEIVRVNFNNGNPKIVEPKFLQPKGKRYYFKDTFALDEDEVFISPLDLNVEHGEIERPFKPMIRFGIPIFDDAKNKRGVIILNYLGAKLIASLVEAEKLSLGDIMLVNSDGYRLCSPIKEDEWGFMIKERTQRKFSNRFPGAWSTIRSSKNCQIYNQNGLFTSATIYPLRQGLKSSSGSTSPYGDSDKRLASHDYYWKVISHISTPNLMARTQSLLLKLFLMAILLFSLASIPSWIIAKAFVKRKPHRRELRRYWDHLEKLVRERTEELMEAKEAAELSNKIKSEFLANVSHELKTPLNAILGFSYILKKKSEDAKAKDYFKKIEFSTNNLILIIDDLPAMSQMRSVKQDSEWVVLDVHHFFNQFIAFFSIEIEKKSLDFTITIDRDVPNFLVLNEVRLRHIIINLLSNAIKFTSSEAITVTVAADHKDTVKPIVDLHIHVEDTGSGISNAFLGQVFDAFQQQDGSSTREIGGLGIGLTVVKRLLMLMGGSISVKSEVNKGTLFEVTLNQVQIANEPTPQNSAREEITAIQWECPPESEALNPTHKEETSMAEKGSTAPIKGDMAPLPDNFYGNMQELIDMLEQFDSEAVEKLEFLLNHVNNDHYRTLLTSIQTHLATYDFERALSDAQDLFTQIPRPTS